jgi:hypothetical protein
MKVQCDYCKRSLHHISQTSPIEHNGAWLHVCCVCYERLAREKA